MSERLRPNLRKSWRRKYKKGDKKLSNCLWHKQLVIWAPKKTGCDVWRNLSIWSRCRWLDGRAPCVGDLRGWVWINTGRFVSLVAVIRVTINLVMNWQQQRSRHLMNPCTCCFAWVRVTTIQFRRNHSSGEHSSHTLHASFSIVSISSLSLSPPWNSTFCYKLLSSFVNPQIDYEMALMSLWRRNKRELYQV